MAKMTKQTMATVIDLADRAKEPRKKRSRARKSKNKPPTRIFAFGGPDAAIPEDARETLFRARAYYNALIAIERDRLDGYRKTRRSFAPLLAQREDDCEAGEKALDAARQAVKDERARVFRKTHHKSDEVAESFLVAVQDAKDKLAALRKLEQVERAAFEATLKPARDEYQRRRDALIAQRACATGLTAPHVRRKINAEVFAAMVKEPVWPKAWKKLQKHDMQANATKTQARAARGFAAGTGGLVETAVAQAIDDSRPRRPQFKSFDGEGRLGGQLRNCPVHQLFNPQNPQIRLTPQPVTVDPNRRTGVPRQAGHKLGQFYTCSVQVGTKRLTGPRHHRTEGFGEEEKDWKTTWIDFPVWLHRELPKDAVVKYFWILVRRVGRRLRYQLQLTLEAESFRNAKRPAGHGTVAINFGWRQLPHGHRIAYWVSEFGTQGEIVVPNTPAPPQAYDSTRRTQKKRKHSLGARLTLPHLLRRYADERFYEVKHVLRKWINGINGNHCTGWDNIVSERNRARFAGLLIEWAEFEIGQERLASLWQTWKTERFARQLDLFVSSMSDGAAWAREHGVSKPAARLAWWCFLWARKDAHLRQYFGDQSRRAHHQRDAFYRDHAIRIGTTFDTLVIDDTDFAKMAKRKNPEETDEAWDKARQNRHTFAPGRCREIFLDIFGPRREKVSASDNSSRCADCGAAMLGATGALTVRCPTHGEVDVDLNNCRNMLRRAANGNADFPPLKTRRNQSSSATSKSEDVPSLSRRPPAR